MRWSLRIGTWFGIQVRVHLTFGLLLLWVASEALSDGQSWLATLVHLSIVSAIFGFVVLHEYGHALTARHYGIRTRAITLYPIGGVAMLEGMPDDPRQELRIALAGPAVNFALAATVWALTSMLFGGIGPVSELLIYANLVMGLFNLVPALPMDGGRVLRAALAMRMSPTRATHVAARVARWLAGAMAIVGLLWPGHGMLVFIALFVWMASAAEVRAAQRNHAARVHLAQVFRARHADGEAPGMQVVYGPDGRPIYIGQP